ncbi:sigma-S stabilization anti-adapter protein IraP [Sodalis sp. C49]|uniref:sigma-S stabilization anti-adapter protein IraP n=1 Tax=unclassified Sodalis (in: enterobacteria) TaxID=2636512 RepID=UPI0039659A3B
MNSLLSQLLITLAQKEAAEKELHATVESLEILVAALISALAPAQKKDVITTVETALDEMRQRTDIAYKSDLDLLGSNIERITAVAKRR